MHLRMMTIISLSCQRDKPESRLLPHKGIDQLDAAVGQVLQFASSSRRSRAAADGIGIRAD